MEPLQREPRSREGYDRIDLHVHSCASGSATNLWVKSLGLGFETRECYTEPTEALIRARRAGMRWFTLTDHETVEGVLSLADAPDVLSGVEICTRFPEDGSTVDILVYGLDEVMHRHLQTLRGDVYRLVDAIRDLNLPYVLAHPLVSWGEPFSRDGVEKRLVLFPIWETINGARPAAQNRLATRVATSVDGDDLRAMAIRHGLRRPEHNCVGSVAGSDDHGGFSIGETWTEIPAVSSIDDVLEALRSGETMALGEHGSAAKMTHTGLKIAGKAYQQAAGRGQSVDAAGVSKYLQYLPLLAVLEPEQIRATLVAASNQAIGEALGGGASVSLLGRLGMIGKFFDAHLMMAPYLGLAGYFGRELAKVADLERDLVGREASQLRVGMFVDDLSSVHGVSTMCLNILRMIDERDERRIQMVTCGEGPRPDVTDLPAIASLPIPMVEGRMLHVPSLLDVVDFIAEREFDVLHIVSPGPLGLAALVAATILGVPVVGGYHTEYGQYAGILTGDSIVADIVEFAVRDFYHRCSVVAVSAASMLPILRDRGYRIDRWQVLRNGVDTALFDPARRDHTWNADRAAGRLQLLYVGRLSREKGLLEFAATFRALAMQRGDLHLVIAGDGPIRAELEQLLGDDATFTGFLNGADLARVYASCDIFVFPSRTDTLGRAIVEAQASGLPAVVYDAGGPPECLIDGKSGIVVASADEAGFLAAIERLADDRVLRRDMGDRARLFAATLTWDAMLDDLMDRFLDVAGLPAPPSSPMVTTRGHQSLTGATAD